MQTKDMQDMLLSIMPPWYCYIAKPFKALLAEGVSLNMYYCIRILGECPNMTMSELAALMADLGCYKAVNLDGGGSTNMVASTVWAENIHTVNKPSENRRVVNAVGISYSSEPGSPAGIVLESDAPSLFIGQSTKISYAVYDGENLFLENYIEGESRL